MKTLLDVGSGLNYPIPDYYNGWRHVRLDIDPQMKPDLLMDARNIRQLPPATYDAVYCSHNLEHYHRHHGIQVIEGFRHILKPGGFAEIRVPDIQAVMRTVVEKKLDMDDVLGATSVGPILVRDVIYGYHVEIERSEQDFYAHKTGFSQQSLAKLFKGRGFEGFTLRPTHEFEICAYFFCAMPTWEQWQLLGLPSERFLKATGQNPQ